MKTARRRAREFAVQGIYEWQLNRERGLSAIEAHLRENEYFAKADQELFGKLLRGVLSDPLALSGQVSPLFDRPSDEVSPVEKAILLVAAYELLNMPETPYPVIINEAIEIAKTFGGNDGHKFVNGILDKLAMTMREAEFEAQRNRRRKPATPNA